MNRRVRSRAGLAVRMIVPVLLQTDGMAMGQGMSDPRGGVSEAVYRAVLCADANGRLTIAAAQPDAGCQSIDLPVSPTTIRWVGALPQATAPGLDRLVLSGTGRGEGFLPTGAAFEERPGSPPRPGALGLDQPLIPALSARVFGVEERATLVRSDAEVTLRCAAGDKPAGLVLDPGRARLPEGAAFTLRWQVAGDPGFAVAHAGATIEGQAVPLPSGGRFDLPPSREASAWEAPRFVLTCPAKAGSLTVSNLCLAAPEPGAGPISRSAWAWRPNRWQEAPERLIAEAVALKTGRLFVTVPIEGGAIADEARFSDFVRLALASGITVAAVEGDPGMALDGGRAIAIGRLSVLAAYQQRSPADRRLAGVQYDIEPYLLPGFQIDPERILRNWAATLDGLSRAAPPLGLDLVLPSWLPLHASAGLVLPTIARVAERVTVMAYRATTAEILTAAEPMLAWSTAASLPLHVAVEAGPVGDETTRTYRRAERGDLLLLPQAAGGALVLLLNEAAAPHGSDRLYAQQRESVFPGARVSFLGDRQRLDEVVAQVSRRCAAWPSFSGMALHGLID